MRWPTISLGELCEINVGKTPSRANKNYWRDGSEPWLSIADMSKGFLVTETKEKITKEAVSSCNCKQVVAGTVLMSFKLSVGKVSVATFPLYTNEAIAALPIKNMSVLSEEYLVHALKSVDLHSGTDRAAMGLTLNKEKLKKIEIPLPPLADQKRIAAILDKAAEIKAKREQAIAKLDELAESTFIELFGDPVVNPKNLKKQKLTEFFKFKTGKLDSNAAIENGKYPFFTCSKDNFLINEFAFDEEALLLAGNNANGDYSVKHYSGRFNAYQRTYVINLANSDNTYEYAKSSLEFMLAQMKRRSKGTSTKYLTMSLFNEMTILVPSKPLQEKYGQIIKKIEDLKRKELIKSAVISNLIYSLQHQAFTKGFNA